jgi:hypothetical protein
VSSLQRAKNSVIQVDVAVFQALGLLNANAFCIPLDVPQLQVADFAGAQPAVQHEQEPGHVHKSDCVASLKNSDYEPCSAKVCDLAELSTVGLQSTAYNVFLYGTLSHR